MTTTELYNIVTESLKTKQPLFVPRIGDGEAMCLSGDREKQDWLFFRQLGTLLHDDDITIIQNNLKKAYQSANIIGMPENKREGLNEFWYKCGEILHEIGAGDKPAVTNDFHNEWLDSGTLKELLTNRDQLYYVSCHDLTERFKEVYNISEVKGFHISGERYFFPEKSGRHYPHQFNQVEQWIDSINMKGALFIYGAGVVGKIYGLWAALQGAVALDLGNVLDLLAGFKTRGLGRAPGARIEKYKI